MHSGSLMQARRGQPTCPTWTLWSPVDTGGMELERILQKREENKLPK
jgi:hypothetical protein